MGGWNWILASGVVPEGSFEFRVVNDDDGDCVFPCSLDDDTFHCDLAFDEGVYVDEVYLGIQSGAWASGASTMCCSTSHQGSTARGTPSRVKRSKIIGPSLR